MAKIKVLHVLMWFEQGGIENFIMNVFRRIDRLKFQFDFALIKKEKGVFDDEIKKLGGNIYYFETEEKTLKNYRNSLKKIIKEHGDYDVIHSHCYYFSGYILKIAKQCGVNIRVAHSHETLKGHKLTLKRKLYEKVMRYLIKRNATNMLSCSDLAGKYVFGESAGYQVLYNGIDAQRFSYNENTRLAVRAKLNISENETLLLNVGRFAHQKNHGFILDVFETLLKQYYNVKLLLIGDGALKSHVVQRIQANNYEDKVIIMSNIKNVEDYYNAADIFILPSHYEGMPIVGVEAQSSGLYTLFSNKITNEVNITDLASFISLDDGVDAWADKIEKLIGLKIDRNNYFKTIQCTPFEITQTVKDLCEVYCGNRQN